MNDIILRLKQIFKNILDYSGEMNDDCCMETISGWDSLSHINLIFAIEEDFDIIIDEEEMIKMDNYKVILEITQKKFQK